MGQCCRALSRTGYRFPANMLSTLLTALITHARDQARQCARVACIDPSQEAALDHFATSAMQNDDVRLYTLRCLPSAIDHARATIATLVTHLLDESSLTTPCSRPSSTRGRATRC